MMGGTKTPKNKTYKGSRTFLRPKHMPADESGDMVPNWQARQLPIEGFTHLDGFEAQENQTFNFGHY